MQHSDLQHHEYVRIMTNLFKTYEQNIQNDIDSLEDKLNVKFDQLKESEDQADDPQQTEKASVT